MDTIQRNYLVAGLAAAMAAPSSTSAAELHVPAQHGTIQAAVDAAADGDTIHIAPGVYIEQVAIRRKSLTLLGRPGTILRAFEDMGDLGFGFRNIILVHGPSEVTLRGISFQGDQLAGLQPDNDEGVGYDTRGVYYVDAGGTIEDCLFSGFRVAGPVVGEARVATAIVFYNDLEDAMLHDVRIARNTIVDSYNGVVMRAHPDETALDVTIEDNVVQGVGPTESYGSNPYRGFDFIGAISGVFTGNSVSGFSYSGEGAPFPFGMGFFVRAGNFPDYVPVLGEWRVENNTFRDNDFHVTVQKVDDIELLGNHLEGAGEGQRVFGIAFSGDGAVVRGNECRDLPVGIIALGDDQPPNGILPFGLISGIATNAVIADNRFCDVETPVWIQPEAAPTATETGTLTCPFPVPALEIATAVEVSWPGFYEGWVLEGSTGLEDWAPVELPVRSGGGRSSVTVPVDQSHHSFRLVTPDSVP